MREVVAVVDGDPQERRLIAVVLAVEGLSVIQVSGVAEGLVAVLNSHPGAVVLAEGFERITLTELVSLFRRVTSAPLIVLGDGGPFEEAQCLEAGGDVYISRPFSVREFVARVRSLLGQSELPAGGARAPHLRPHRYTRSIRMSA